MAYFIVIYEQDAAWDSAHSMREQAQWSEHASFMDSLVDQGVIVLGGPIKGGAIHQARLIIKAQSESEVRNRLLDDPWVQSRHLKILSIEPWEVLLGKNG